MPRETVGAKHDCDRAATFVVIIAPPRLRRHDVAALWIGLIVIDEHFDVYDPKLCREDFNQIIGGATLVFDEPEIWLGPIDAVGAFGQADRRRSSGWSSAPFVP